jgi:hypothetical protein
MAAAKEKTIAARKVPAWKTAKSTARRNSAEPAKRKR